MDKTVDTSENQHGTPLSIPLLIQGIGFLFCPVLVSILRCDEEWEKCCVFTFVPPNLCCSLVLNYSKIQIKMITSLFRNTHLYNYSPELILANYLEEYVVYNESYISICEINKWIHKTNKQIMSAFFLDWVSRD